MRHDTVWLLPKNLESTVAENVSAALEERKNRFCGNVNNEHLLPCTQNGRTKQYTSNLNENHITAHAYAAYTYDRLTLVARKTEGILQYPPTIHRMKNKSKVKAKTKAK